MKILSKRRFRRIKDWVKFVLAIACVVVFVIFFIFNIWSPVRKPMSVVVPRGASVTGMTNYLYNKGSEIEPETECLQAVGGPIRSDGVPFV